MTIFRRTFAIEKETYVYKGYDGIIKCMKSDIIYPFKSKLLFSVAV